MNYFYYLCTRFQTNEHWRDGRVVDYSSLENYRTERYRGFESLSLRQHRWNSASYKLTPRFTPTFGESGCYFTPTFESRHSKQWNIMLPHCNFNPTLTLWTFFKKIAFDFQPVSLGNIIRCALVSAFAKAIVLEDNNSRRQRWIMKPKVRKKQFSER